MQTEERKRKMREYSRAHRKAGGEELRLREREYDRSHPRKRKQYSGWSKEEWRAYGKAYREKNKERINANRRKNYLAKTFGTARDWYEKTLEEQGGKCAICGKIPRIFTVDHNHETGCVRGILCSNCNTGIGLFKESEENLVSAIEYLKKWYNK